MKKPKYYVFVSGGCVQNIRNNKGEPVFDAEVCVVDFDNEESGQCAVCMTEREDMGKPCPKCGYDLANGGEREAIARDIAVRGGGSCLNIIKTLSRCVGL